MRNAANHSAPSGQGQAPHRSHYHAPIPNDGKLHGWSRNPGDAPDHVRAATVTAIIEECKSRNLSKPDAALVLAIARLESGFNPDAANPTSSASGIGQFIDKTASHYGLDAAKRFDLHAGAKALVDHYIDNKALAASRGQGADFIYKYHHDGPSANSGGMALSRNEVMPYAKAYVKSSALERFDDHSHGASKNLTDRAVAAAHAVKSHTQEYAGTHTPAPKTPETAYVPRTSAAPKAFAEQPPSAPAANGRGLDKAAHAPTMQVASHTPTAHHGHGPAVHTALAKSGGHDTSRTLAHAEPKTRSVSPDSPAQPGQNKVSDLVVSAMKQGMSSESVRALVDHRFADGVAANGVSGAQMAQHKAEALALLGIEIPNTKHYAQVGPQPHAEHGAGATKSPQFTEVASLEQVLAAHMSERGFDSGSVKKAPEIAAALTNHLDHKTPADQSAVLHKTGDVLVSVGPHEQSVALAREGNSVVKLDAVASISQTGLASEDVARLRGLAPQTTARHSDMEVFQSAPAGLVAMAKQEGSSPELKAKVGEFLNTLERESGSSFAKDQATARVAERQDRSEQAQQSSREMVG